MRKLMFLIAMLLLAQLAEAKTILYVANTSTDSSCNAMQSSDSLYCNRLLSLGYNVKVINELHVKDNTTTWNEYADASDMIFLGNNNFGMANKTRFQNIFCGNISSKNKPLFFTYVNTWTNNKTTEGCAFYPPINLVTANFSDNKCSTKAFKIAKAGFITEGFNIGDNITIYPSPKIVKFYNPSNGGWISAECVPPNGSIDFYPVLFANDKGVFWGLDEPSSFSSLTWDIFDRTVLYFLNDTVWTISAFTLPSVASVDQDIFIFATVTQSNKTVTGIVNYTVDEIKGNMNYENGLWKSNIRLSEARQHNIILTAYSKTLRGVFSLPITVGDSVFNITSSNFKPNSRYVVSARIPGATSASYRILNPYNYSVLLTGALSCENDNCAGIVESMPDTVNLLLEVTTPNGGTLKAISKESLSTDKIFYKPGEVVRVDFFTTDPVTKVNLTIIRPDGTKETPSPLFMDKISANFWNKNYTLGTNSYNGTYIINVKTANGEYTKNISVIAWNPFAYLNKNVLNVFESFVLTIGTTEAYSSNLDIYVSAEITRPDGNITALESFTVKGNKNYNISYTMPRGYPSGSSRIKINLKDSDNRTSTLYLNFSTNIALLQPSLFVTPSIISITTVQGKTIEKTVTVENTAQVKTNTLISSVSDIDATVNAPSSLEAKEKGEARIIINTGGLSEGPHTGKVNFYSQVGDTEVDVIIEIIGDIAYQASEKYAEISSLENNLTYLAKMWVNTTEALIMLNNTKAMLNETIKEFYKEDYANAKAKFEEASAKVTELETTVSGLYGKMPDYSFIIWDFAAAVVVIIITVTIIKIKGRRKKRKVVKKQIPKEEPKKEEVYFEPKGGEYRTEYY
jgi:hypothetical protein